MQNDKPLDGDGCWAVARHESWRTIFNDVELLSAAYDDDDEGKRATSVAFRKRSSRGAWLGAMGRGGELRRILPVAGVVAALKDARRARVKMVVLMLMYSPSVYNQSCQWSSAGSVSWLAGRTVNVSSEQASSAFPPQPYQPSQLYVSGYDLFRCTVVLIVTCGLILGNLILALAVNSKHTAGILQFQVSFLSFFVRLLMPRLFL